MEDETILAQACDSWFSATNQQTIVLLEPLYVLNPATGDWEDIDGVERKFPNRGRVTWVKPHEDVMMGSVWACTYEPHPGFDSTDSRHDRFRINWNNPPKPLQEVIRLEAYNADEVFKTLEHGLSLSFVPAKAVYLVLDDQSWAGPLRLIQEQGKWTLDPRQREHPIPRVSALPRKDCVEVYVDAQRLFVRANVRAPVKIGELDWAPAQLVLKRLLREIRKNDELNQRLGLTNKAIRDAVEAFPTDQSEVVAQRVARARAFIKNAERVQAELQSFETELLAVPTVAARIANAEREGRAQAKAKVEQEYAEEAVDREMRRRADELSALEAQIAERRRELDAQLSHADATISARVAEMIAKPAEALAQVALVRAALGNGYHESRNGHAPVSTASTIHPPAAALQAGEEQVANQPQFVKSVRQQFNAAAIPSSVAQSIHAAFLSGIMPVLDGPGALEALETYARCTTGERLLQIQTLPTMLEPADLLGRIGPHSRQFIPHAAGLLDLLLFAQQPDQADKLFLVVLEGVNRAAVDSYLLPVLAAHRSALCTEEGRTLSLAHPAAFSAGDPYAVAARLRWPSNVLLAGTLTDGVVRLPLPASLWKDACYIPVETPSNSTVKMQSAQAPRTSVTVHAWKEWRTQALSETHRGLQALHEFNTDGVRVPAAVAHAFARFYSSSQLLLKSDQDTLKTAVRCVLAPYAVATDQLEALGQVLEVDDIGLSIADVRAMQQVLS
jgi:hypothetical protein